MMKMLRVISFAVGLASLVSSAAYTDSTLPAKLPKVTDPKPATVQSGQQSNTAILALPNKTTDSEKRMLKSAGPNNPSAPSSVAGQDVRLIPIPQPPPTQQ